MRRTQSQVTGLSIGVATLLSFACGGSATETPAGKPAVQTAPAEAVAGQQMTIGGGKATLVHPGNGGSPHVKVDWVESGANISITYGRPYLKGRVIGKTVEPMDGQVWRLGADEATTLTSDKDLMIGTLHAPAGSYTLWVLDSGDTWELIVNRQTAQWGTDYDPGGDLGRTKMTVTPARAPADQLTLSIADGAIKVHWGTTTAAVPIVVH
jgi:hypothetical protein